MINNPPVVNGSSEPIGFDSCTNNEVFLGNTAILLLKANPKRIYTALINNSTADITLNLGNTKDTALNKGIILKAKGGSYEITVLNLYLGPISGISTADARISIVECIK